jgi:hypothetical protein
MAFADPAPKGCSRTTATAAGLFLSSDINHVHFARAASVAVIGHMP